MNRNRTAPAPEWQVDGRRRVLATIRELYPDFEGIGKTGFVVIEDPDPPLPQLSLGPLLPWRNGPWVLRCTRRALEIFDDRQLRSAVAHELSHAALGHSRTATLPELMLYVLQDASWLMRVGLVARWVDRTVAIVSARRRRHEMEADIGAVALTRDPEAMISSLDATYSALGADYKDHFHPRPDTRVELIRRAGKHMDQLAIPDLSRPLKLHAKAPRPRAMGTHELGG